MDWTANADSLINDPPKPANSDHEDESTQPVIIDMSMFSAPIVGT